MSRRNLANRRIVVTGASSGIGREIALELARRHANLLVTARRETPLVKLAEEIGQLGPKAIVVVGDLTQEAVRQQIIGTAEQALSGLDILVNNAGISAHGRFQEATPERLRTIMEVNFFATAELTRLALPLLQQGNHSMVVNVGSVLAYRGIPHNSEYCASKFAVRGWSESLRSEFARQGIDLLLIHPGTTDTPFFENLIDKNTKLPWSQPRGVPASYVAQRTVRAIERGKSEIVPSGSGRFLVWANRFLPRLVDRILRRYG